MPSNLEKHLKQVGDRLKALRVENGYSSYRQFADAHDLEAKQYWKLEAGKSDFRQSSLLRILEIHDISLKDFIKSLD